MKKSVKTDNLKLVKAPGRIRSAKAVMREFYLAKELSKNCSIELNANRRARTADLLKEQYNIDVRSAASPGSLLSTVRNSENRLMVRSATKRYLQAIVYVYALYEWIMSSQKVEIYLDLLCTEAEVRPTPKLNVLRTVTRFVICYEQENSEKENVQRKYWSRDAKAIQWLIDEKVAPANVEAYQEKHGGGVDEWARLASKTAPGATGKNAEKTSALLIEAGPEKANESSTAGGDELPEDDPNFVAALSNVISQRALSRDKGILILFVGDADNKARIVGAEELGLIKPGTLRQSLEFDAVAEIARRLLKAPG